MFNIQHTLVLLDAAAAVASLAAGQYLRLGLVEEFYPIYYARTTLYMVVVLVAGFFCELYAGERSLPFFELAARIAISIMVSFFMISAGLYAVDLPPFGRGVLSLALLIFGALQLLLHRACRVLSQAQALTKRVLILGVGPLAAMIERAMPDSPYNYVFVGFVQPDSEKPEVAAELVLGSLEQIEEIISREQVDKLIVSMSERRGLLPVRKLLACKLRGVEIVDAPSFYEQLTGKLQIEGIQPSWFLYSAGFRVTPFKRKWKRVLDVFFSSLGLLLTMPVMPAIAVAIKMSSPGPVFFRQRRVGESGDEFTLLKFRTMCDDAEKESGPVWASANDPRVTPLGRFLRKTRIDEIPQMFNVFKGEMSFVGPRPERREFVEQLTEQIPYYGKRHFVKPGVTGWAQVKYPYGASEKDALEKLRYDLYYIKNYTITLDLVIMLETIKVVLFGRGGR